MIRQPLQAWETSDGDLHRSEEQAEAHQMKLDARASVEAWCGQWLYAGMGLNDVAEQMIDNIEELREALGCGT